jgi:ABC-2 type transport system permease protein
VTVSGTILISVVTTLVVGALLFSGLAMGGLAAISGVFYPITHLPHWLQWAGQVFPLYWLGLGTRPALLPANLASVEIGHSWRHLATFGVLSAWAVAGLLVAPILLRRWRAASPGRAWPRAARRSCGR